jgi:hypothetical protein
MAYFSSPLFEFMMIVCFTVWRSKKEELVDEPNPESSREVDDCKKGQFCD